MDAASIMYKPIVEDGRITPVLRIDEATGRWIQGVTFAGANIRQIGRWTCADSKPELQLSIPEQARIVFRSLTSLLTIAGRGTIAHERIVTVRRQMAEAIDVAAQSHPEDDRVTELEEAIARICLYEVDRQDTPNP